MSEYKAEVLDIFRFQPYTFNLRIHSFNRKVTISSFYLFFLFAPIPRFDHDVIKAIFREGKWVLSLICTHLASFSLTLQHV